MRLRKAHAMLLRGEFPKAQSLYVLVLNTVPEEFMALSAHAGLAETEFNMGSVSNSKYYASQYIKSVEANPTFAESLDLEKQIEKMRWYCNYGE
jgi:hypothetical protein